MHWLICPCIGNYLVKITIYNNIASDKLNIGRSVVLVVTVVYVTNRQL